MAFDWGVFTGKTQRREAERATADANTMLKEGRDRALAALSGGTAGAMASLATGYGTARTDTQAGADRARTDIGAGYDTARSDLGTQYGRAEDAVTGYLNPFVQSGQNAQNLYDVALGTGGTPTDRASFYEAYANNDPFRAFRDEQANRALQSQFNARGQSNSGRFATAISRSSLERGTADLNQYLDRLARQGELGGQYASRAASELSGLRSRLGDQYGNLEASRGNALGGLAERTGNRLGGLGYQYGSDQANINAGQGQAIANLEYGNAQQGAGLRIGLGNARQAAASVLPNFGMNLLGTAVRAATPGYGGATAFDNLSSGFSRLASPISNRLIPGYPGS